MKLVRYIYFLCVYAVYLVYVYNNAVNQFVLVSVMSCAREMVSCSVVACTCLHNYYTCVVAYKLEVHYGMVST